MKYIILSLFLTGCCSIPEPEVITVEVPVIRPNVINQLEPFVSECGKLTTEDRFDFKKIAEACKNDLEILKKRDQIHRQLIEENNKLD